MNLIFLNILAHNSNPAYTPLEGGGLDGMMDIRDLRERSVRSGRSNSRSPPDSMKKTWVGQTRDSQFEPPGKDGLIKSIDDMAT